MFKKLLTSFLITIFLLGNLASSVKAQEAGPWYNQTYREWWNKVYKDSSDDEIFGERYTAAQVQWVVYGLISIVLNSSTDPETTSCLMNNDLKDCVNRVTDFLSAARERDKYIAGEKKGVLAFILSDRPLSGISYAKSVARKFSLIPEAQAQTGFGFSALDPILPLWRAARNAAYALIVIVTLVMAFMIMFRVKISPQTVISIQSALPKIAVAVILITFSYAIAGLLVDIMYLVIGFLSLVIASGINLLGWSPSTSGVFGFMTQGFLGAGAMGLSMLYMFLFAVVIFPVFMGSAGLGGQVLGIIPLLGFLLALIIVVLVFVMLLFISIKILWMLLKTFANTLLLVLVAPFQILLGAVSPGGGFSAWMRTYLANLAVFPTVGVLFVLSYVFLIQAFWITTQNFLPTSVLDFFAQLGLGIPVVGSILAATAHQGWPPLLVFGFPPENAIAVLFVGVSVVILFILPKTVDMIKALVEGKPFALGTAIGEAFGPALWGGKQAFGTYGAPLLETAREESLRGFMKALRKRVTPESTPGKIIQATEEKILGRRK